MRAVLLVLLAIASHAFAGTGPAPSPKQTVTFTQGTTSRTITATTPDVCLTYTANVIQGRAAGCKSGSFVQFPQSGGAVSVLSSLQQKCGAIPPPLVVVKNCAETNPGTEGKWTQTITYAAAAYPACSVASPPVPLTAPPDACKAVTPPPATGLQPPKNQADLLPVAKPARGVPFTTQYGTTETRITDHAVDRPGSDCLRNDYSRRQPFNADGSKVVVYQCGGAWLVYDTRTFAFKVLNGPGGDAEVQWHPTDPDKLRFMDTNGGTRLYELTVSTNTYVVLYDMTAQAQAALGPQCDRLWTRSEGSPSADGSRWGFICQHYNQSTGNFDTLGLIVFDINAKTVLWSQRSATDYDHVSMTPSGRYLVPSGDRTFAIDMSGNQCTLRDGGEHSDTFVLPNGHDGYFSDDYQTPGGDMFYVDIDLCFANGSATRVVLDDLHIYQSAMWGTNGTGIAAAKASKPHPIRARAKQKTAFASKAPTDACANRCSFHFSGRAFGKPGTILISQYGTPKAQMIVVDVVTRELGGIAVTMSDDETYWAEVQGAIRRDGRAAMFNDNFNGVDDVDAYMVAW